MSPTPGPWVIGKRFDCHATIVGADGLRVARTECRPTSGREDMHAGNAHCFEENANLILAAPDLLEALKACRRQLYEWDTEDSAATSLANMAIAKAEGAAVEVDEPVRLVQR